MSETKNKLEPLIPEKELSTNKSVTIIKPLNIQTNKNNNLNKLSETFDQEKIKMKINNSSLINIKNIKIFNKSNYEIKSIKKQIQSKEEIISKNNNI